MAEQPEDMSPTASALAAELSPRRLPVIPNYEILDLLGEGGMGAVYRARDQRLNRIVALKVIKNQFLDLTNAPSGRVLARFQREAEAIARLNHPHIVQVYETGWFVSRTTDSIFNGAVPYLSMEYVGDNLGKRLRPPGEPMDVARVVRLVARGVQHAHKRGILHRDIKPSNVLLGPPADEPALNCRWGCPKLADFGLARPLNSDDRRLTSSGAVVGTPGYMAPSRFRVGGKMLGRPPTFGGWGRCSTTCSRGSGSCMTTVIL